MVTKPAKPAIMPIPYAAGAVVDDRSIDYPSSDGAPMAETELQYVPLTDTVSALRVRYHGRSDVYIAGDMLIYYRMNRPEFSVAPDVYAVFGALGNHPRDSWLVWREGKAPDFVMEIASQSTWQRDRDAKRDIYAGMGVTEYWRYDPTGRFFTPALVGERLVGGTYRRLPLATDAAGVLRCHSGILELDICVLPGLELRLYDPAAEEWLRTHQETADALRSSETALRRSENARRESENARRASESARQTETAARRAAESEVAQLRAQLRQLQQSQP